MFEAVGESEMTCLTTDISVSLDFFFINLSC